MSSSKILPGHSTQVRQWLPPEMGNNNATTRNHDATATPKTPPTAAELEAIQQEAYAEGYEKGQQEGFEFGHKEGLAKSTEQIQQYVTQMEQLLCTFSDPLRELDNRVEKELLNLIIAIVRQLVRREVKSDPNLIIGVVREALSILPVSAQHIRLLVHPEDAGLIRKVYALGDTEVGWNLVEDPVISRGGCKVVTDSSQVDATLDSRLASLIAPMLAGARSVDEEPKQA